MTTATLSSISDLKAALASQTVPIFFISPSNFNLMGLERWVSSFYHINYIDCFDGANDRVFIPKIESPPHFESLEAVNTYLLGHKEVVNFIESTLQAAGAERGMAMFLFFDREIEVLCEELKLDIMLPENKLVKHIDNKIVTTQIGNAAGVASVPNVLGPVGSYKALRETADRAGLGDKLVVQTAYGDSGKTTFFIETEADYDKVSEKIEGEGDVKVMTQIRCLGTAIEACATAKGTYVGPMLTELIGRPELTPYKGGWCGNELYQAAFAPDVRDMAHRHTEAIGNALYAKGYRGYFEVDYLIDLDTDEVYLGELNPRITGISAMTNMSPFCQANVPLFLFHIADYLGLASQVDPSEFNALSLADGASGSTGQLIVKHTLDGLQILESAPVSGVYERDGDGALSLVNATFDRFAAMGEGQVYLLRIMAAGEMAYKGGDLAILFTNHDLQTDEQLLTAQAMAWTQAVGRAFVRRDLTDEEAAIIARYKNPALQLKGFSDD